jgi:beta-phosphoglucomutase
MEPQNPFQAAIFDMDGTLVDNMSFHSRALIEVTKRRLGIELSVERSEREFAGVKNAEILAIIAGRHVDATEAALWSEEKDARYRELYGPHLGLIRGARELLTRLRQAGLGVALASAAPIGNRDFVLDGLAVRCLFDQIVGQEDAARGKPAPDLFLVAASRLGLDPSVCVVFEDAVNGILGAQAAGMQAVGLTTVCDDEELRAAGACWTMPDLSELPVDLARRLFG